MQERTRAHTRALRGQRRPLMIVVADVKSRSEASLQRRGRCESRKMPQGEGEGPAGDERATRRTDRSLAARPSQSRLSQQTRETANRRWTTSILSSRTDREHRGLVTQWLGMVLATWGEAMGRREGGCELSRTALERHLVGSERVVVVGWLVSEGGIGGV